MPLKQCDFVFKGTRCGLWEEHKGGHVAEAAIPENGGGWLECEFCHEQQSNFEALSKHYDEHNEGGF